MRYSTDLGEYIPNETEQHHMDMAADALAAMDMLPMRIMEMVNNHLVKYPMNKGLVDLTSAITEDLDDFFASERKRLETIASGREFI